MWRGTGAGAGLVESWESGDLRQWEQHKQSREAGNSMELDLQATQPAAKWEQRAVRKEAREDRGARLSRTYHSVRRIDQEIKNYGLLAKYGPSLGFVKATS